jgi:Zn-finger nucleic acid-binding protein
MKCPACNETLLMSEKKGVEIDYCPSCRGVWLDRGELEKIIERSAEHYSARGDNDLDRKTYEHGRQDNDRYGRHPYKKKESFLSDLFDF